MERGSHHLPELHDLEDLAGGLPPASLWRLSLIVLSIII